VTSHKYAAARERLFAEFLHTGEGRIGVAFTLDELEELAFATGNAKTRARLITAIGLFDHDLADRIEREASW
jgi:hypothetical protein